MGARAITCPRCGEAHEREPEEDDGGPVSLRPVELVQRGVGQHHPPLLVELLPVLAVAGSFVAVAAAAVTLMALGG